MIIKGRDRLPVSMSVHLFLLELIWRLDVIYKCYDIQIDSLCKTFSQSKYAK